MIKFDNNILDGSQQDGQQKLEIDLVFCFVLHLKLNEQCRLVLEILTLIGCFCVIVEIGMVFLRLVHVVGALQVILEAFVG